MDASFVTFVSEAMAAVGVGVAVDDAAVELVLAAAGDELDAELLWPEPPQPAIASAAMRTPGDRYLRINEYPFIEVGLKAARQLGPHRRAMNPSYG